MTRAEKLLNNFPDNFAAVITSAVGRRYFASIKSSAGVLVLTKRKSYCIIDFRYIEMAEKTAVGFECRMQKGSAFAMVKQILDEENITAVGYEQDFLTARELSSLQKQLDCIELVPISDSISDLRAVKDESEISFIKKAQAVTDASFEHIVSFIRPGMTERHVALELEFFARKNGADCAAFEFIVVSGANSSLPHGVPTDKIIEKGDFITMDFGAAVNGYVSDMTRTIAVGYVTDEMKHVYDTVLSAQLAAEKYVKAGLSGHDIDKIARDIIDGAGYEGKFGHSLGHGVGLEIHEAPNFSPSFDKPIPCGAVVTNEPGIYLPDKFGVRIEDMLLVTDSGSVNLTHSPKELIIV